MGIGHLFILLGVVFVLLGLFWSFGFKMPGDYVYEGKNWSFYFPLGTSFVLSVIVSLLLWLWYYFTR